jgi:hypothetical protein
MTPIEHLRSTIEKDIFDYTQLMFGLSDYKKPRDVVTRLFCALPKMEVTR